MAITNWSKEKLPYSINDIVFYAGKFYISTSNNNYNVPIRFIEKSVNQSGIKTDKLEYGITNNNSWQLIEILN